MIPFDLEELPQWILELGADFTTFTPYQQVIIILLTSILVWIVIWFTCTFIDKIVCRFRTGL